VRLFHSVYRGRAASAARRARVVARADSVDDTLQ
jgi:hypothetical protein